MLRDREPAQIARARRRTEVARELRRSAHAHGYDLAEVAEHAGARPHKGRRWASEDGYPHESPQLADVAAMPEAVAVDLLRWAAREMGRDLVVREPRCADHHTLALDAQRESAEATSADLTALADGHWSPQERAESAREHREAEHAHGQAARAQEAALAAERAEIRARADASRRTRVTETA